MAQSGSLDGGVLRPAVPLVSCAEHTYFLRGRMPVIIKVVAHIDLCL